MAARHPTVNRGEAQTFWEGGSPIKIRRIYREKGLEGQRLEGIAEAITAHRGRWLREMLREELGIEEQRIGPLAGGLVTFSTFARAGFLPLLPYVLAFFAPGVISDAFGISTAATGPAPFGAGAARRFMTRRSWWRSGLELLAIGGLAAACAFLVGSLLRGLFV